MAFAIEMARSEKWLENIMKARIKSNFKNLFTSFDEGLGGTRGGLTTGEPEKFIK